MTRAPRLLRRGTVAAVCLLTAAPLSLAQVELRRGGTVGTKVLSVSESGVVVESAEGKQIVGWERVKRVAAERSGEADAFAETSDRAWRAVERLRRGDVAASEPLFDELYRVYQGKTGPTAGVVSEGLARCRTARGAVAAAIVPWLNAIAARVTDESAPQWVGGTIDAGVFVDREYGLSPALPPVWLRGAALDSLMTSAAWDGLKKNPGMAGELAAVYELAAKLQREELTPSEQSELLTSAPDVKSSGAALVLEMLTARFGDDAERASARALLQTRIDNAAPRPRSSTEARPQTPRWVEAWCRFAIGESLAHETDDRTRLKGVIEMLHLPARFATDQPYLAGLALAEGADALMDVGDAAGAGVLKHEAITKYPRHPALLLERIKSIKATTPQATNEE